VVRFIFGIRADVENTRYYDESGTFDVDMVVRLDVASGTTTANWKVVGGTGAYSSLKGYGKLVGVLVVPGVSITDTNDRKITLALTKFNQLAVDDNIKREVANLRPLFVFIKTSHEKKS
jgi:hypothetical protein